MVNTNCILWTKAKRSPKSQYGQTTYVVNGVRRSTSAHRLAWEDANYWVVPKGIMVLHSCDNPPCINPEHLRLGTGFDNAKDKSERRRIHGERNPHVKLSEADVAAIRAAPLVSQKIVAEMYGINVSHVWRIRAGVNR